MLYYKRYAIIPSPDGWRIWDTRLEQWCGKFLEPDQGYYAATRDVAEMRIRDQAPCRRPKTVDENLRDLTRAMPRPRVNADAQPRDIPSRLIYLSDDETTPAILTRMGFRRA